MDSIQREEEMEYLLVLAIGLLVGLAAGIWLARPFIVVVSRRTDSEASRKHHQGLVS